MSSSATPSQLPDPAPTRPSAAIVLSREIGDSTEVFLVERSPRLRFFGGFSAFPGGVMDVSDGASEAATAYRRAAVRELFEETGVLLSIGSQGWSAADRESLRERPARGRGLPRRFCSAEQLERARSRPGGADLLV